MPAYADWMDTLLIGGQKNQDSKIIVLYDGDESLSHRAVTTLVERGYDNIFMLSGGMVATVSLARMSNSFQCFSLLTVFVLHTS